MDFSLNDGKNTTNDHASTIGVVTPTPLSQSILIINNFLFPLPFPPTSYLIILFCQKVLLFWNPPTTSTLRITLLTDGAWPVQAKRWMLGQELDLEASQYIESPPPPTVITTRQKLVDI